MRFEAVPEAWWFHAKVGWFYVLQDNFALFLQAYLCKIKMRIQAEVVYHYLRVLLQVEVPRGYEKAAELVHIIRINSDI
jgi:hypothetical protein